MLEVAMALINNGKSMIDHIDYESCTALILACVNNIPDVALALIGTGESNPSQLDIEGISAFDYVCENNMLEVAIELVNIGATSIEDLIKRKPEWIYEFYEFNPIDIVSIDI